MQYYPVVFNTIVPPLEVEVSINVSRFLSDNIVTFSCLVDLPATVTNGETVVITWSGPSGQLGNSSSVTISNAYATGSGVFQSDVTISDFIPATHNGEYICNATIIPLSSYVIGSSGADAQSVILSG